MVKVRFYDKVDDRKLKFAVIAARTGGHWVFCKHRERDTLEMPGGHREPGEDILTTAKRELYEETGAVDLSIEPVCAYSVTAPWNFDGEETFGMLFRAEVRAFEEELHSEIERIVIQDDLPEKWTYPDIQPLLIREALKRRPDALCPPALGTERLILRPWREEDAKECYRYARDPRVGPIAGWPAHSSEEESRRVIRDVLSSPETYAIVLKETGLPVGSVGLHHNDLAEEDDEAELGYWLGVPYWGKGIVPEAAREILRHAFEDLGLRRVWCGYYDGNLRSRRVQEKLGFRYQWTSQNVEVPQMNETRTGHVSLLTRDQWRVSRSLDSFDNHDPRIPYYELLLEKDLDDMPEPPLPAGYHYRYYAPGDKETWIDIEKSAKEFETHGEGEDAWKRYYAGRESELENRMFFVTDDSGQALATATAFYDIHTGDDRINGWLHWVAVRRDAQGRGLSKPLITHVLRHMKKLGYGHAVVPTQTTTWLACKVYLDLGFRPMPGNLKRSGTGWRIIRTLTDHPALSGLAPVPNAELIKKG